MQTRPWVRGLALAVVVCFARPAAARELTFEDRVAAQTAIERVYFAHRAWPADNPAAKPAFEAAVADHSIRTRVDEYLAKSQALEASWNRPITAADLQGELDRMARSTKDPQLLRELFEALGNDPFVLAETLARQNLADNLLRDEFAGRNGSAAGFESWWAGRKDAVQAFREPGGAYVLPPIGGEDTIASTTPAARFGQSSVWTGDAMIVWGSESFANSGSIYDPATDTWTPTSTGAGVPSGRGRHSAVWTGAEMIVWGGLTASGETNTGGRYVPATDSWTATSTGSNCPSARQRHTAVWTGTRMIVFGGSAGSTFTNTGGVYDPGTDSWTATSTGANVPSIRDQHTAIWTGAQMIVWGGSDATVRLSTGSRYTPETDSWVALPTTGGPVARNRHTAVWTGTQMIVWGGFAPPYLNSGSKYNPTLNSWTATIPTGAPSIRGGHTAVWTGSEMIVWGGQNATVALDNGGRYNPAANTWAAIGSALGSPAARYGHSAVFVRGQMIVWGGNSGSSTLDTGALYDTFAASWQATAAPAPVIRFHPRAASARLGASAIFSVTARGDAPLVYQWRRGGSDLNDGPGISGATTDTLKLSHLSAADAASYSVVVTNANGTATSGDAALTVSTPQAGDLDGGFRVGSGLDSDSIYKAVAQSDGRTILAGNFTTVDGAARGRIARLNADGSNDHTFMNGLSGASDTILEAVVLPDGRILIGGVFSSVNGVARGSIARLNADGSLDPTFQNGMAGAAGGVWAIHVLPDGKLLVGGSFHTFNGFSDRNGLVRLNPDGSLDNTYPHPVTAGLWGYGEWVSSIAVQSDGKIVVGGYFSTFNRDPLVGIARLNADGTTDTSFPNHDLNQEVNFVSVLPDGGILMAGAFDWVSGVLEAGLARLNPDGSLDGGFMGGTNPTGGYYQRGSVAVQPDGKIMIAGGAFNINGVTRNGIALLNADGTIDTSFQNGMSGFTGFGRAVAFAPGGKVVVAGGFSAVNGVPRNRVARLNADGSLDGAFTSSFGRFNGVGTGALQLPDGRLLVSGTFTTIDGVAARGIVRLQADGTRDASFVSAPDDGAVNTFVRQPDGRILIGGYFTSIAGTARGWIARLNADGTLDTGFQSDVTGDYGFVSEIVLQPDGRVLIGGRFAAVNGVPRSHVARLNADGSLDLSFIDPQVGDDPYDQLNALALQPDGRVLVGGDFNIVAGVTQHFLARLNADGSLDGSFQFALAFGGFTDVRAIVVQPDGKILVGGELPLGGVSRGNVARLNADGTLDTSFLDGMSGVGLSGTYEFVSTITLMPDGRVVVGGFFDMADGVPRRGIARLNADGSLDTSFQDGMSGVEADYYRYIRAISVQGDGRLLVAGDFAAVNGVATGPLVRLYGVAPVAPAITTQPANQVAYEGSCAVFHVEASGTPVDYRWRRSGIDLSDSATVSGSESATLTLTGVTAANAGSYDVVITNVLGSETSVTVSLIVEAVPQCMVATCDPDLGSVLVAAPPPGEIAAVHVDGHAPSTLSWSNPGGVVFDVAASTLADLRAFGTLGATCLANDVATAGYSDVQPNPPAGSGYYYLVRAQGVCGDGNYGANSAGAPRAVAACP